MVKQRIIFGVLMGMFFIGLCLFDGWLDGSITISTADNKPVKGTLLCILLILLVVLGQLELGRLAAENRIKIFRPFSIVASVLFVTAWYLCQLIGIQPAKYVLFLSVFSLLGLFLYQYFVYGTKEVTVNCGANYFFIIYVGLLAGLCLAIRIDFGLWPFMIFIFAVKSADIGAYAIGSSFGKHKFCPGISPGKTWEGIGGATAIAIVVAVLFAVCSGIMVSWLAALFGFCLAVLGQLGDLAESMIKRDARQKDSANNVPGFGGILDIIDSPLAVAPFAYLFFMWSC